MLFNFINLNYFSYFFLVSHLIIIILIVKLEQNKLNF